jgi:hypothetical protein
MKVGLWLHFMNLKGFLMLQFQNLPVGDIQYYVGNKMKRKSD